MIRGVQIDNSDCILIYVHSFIYVYKNVFLPALAEHSYFSADFMLRIFLYLKGCVRATRSLHDEVPGI